MTRQLSSETIAKINEIIKDIETELGSPCVMRIDPFTGQSYNNNEHFINIGEYKNVEIYDATTEYKSMEGIYECTAYSHGRFNFRWIADKLYWDERFFATARYSTRDGSCIAGICRNCKKYKTPDADTYFNLTNVGINDRGHTECQICGEDWTKCKFYGMVLDQSSMNIYKYTPDNKKDMKMKLLVNKYTEDDKTSIIAKFKPIR